MREAIPPLPRTSSWRDAMLSTGHMLVNPRDFTFTGAGCIEADCQSLCGQGIQPCVGSWPDLARIGTFPI
jgi:hypothetical protein